MKSPYYTILAYYRVIAEYEYMLVSVGAYSSENIKTDDALYECSLEFHKNKIENFGQGVTIIAYGDDVLPTSFMGSPLEIEDHDERYRVFFTDRVRFLESINDEDS